MEINKYAALSSKPKAPAHKEVVTDRINGSAV
jgi:hypothetical protein